MATVKIQHRRGSYTDFDPSQLDSAEIAVTLSNDPNASDGKAIYVGVGSGNVKQLATVEDMESAVETAVNGAISEVTDKVDEYIEEIETKTLIKERSIDEPKNKDKINNVLLKLVEKYENNK